MRWSMRDWEKTEKNGRTAASEAFLLFSPFACRIFDFDLLDSHYEWHSRDKHFSRLFLRYLLNLVGIDIVKYEYIFESKRFFLIVFQFNSGIRGMQLNFFFLGILSLRSLFFVALCESCVLASVIMSAPFLMIISFPSVEYFYNFLLCFLLRRLPFSAIAPSLIYPFHNDMFQAMHVAIRYQKSIETICK